MKRLRPVDDWRLAPRMNSVRLAALLTLLSVLQTEALPLLQLVIPPAAWPWVTAAFGLAIVVTRLLKQALQQPPPRGPGP